jgi:hypothetical protein
MPSVDMLRPYVERLLAEWLQTDDLVVDDDGDVPIRFGSALYYVGLVDRDPPLVRVWSTVLRDVEKSPELLDAINDVNTRIIQCRMFFDDGAVTLATEVIAEELGKEELIEVCNAIATIADDFDDDLQGRFGGTRGFD